ncbi:PAS domain-containing protein [Methylobacterium komagatae]
MDSPIPQSVLEASGVVGTWMHDHWAGRLSLSGRFPGLMGFDPDVAARGVPLSAFLDRTHPDDRARIENYFYAVGAMGGPMEAEFRTCDAQAGIRTLVMRGRIERDPTGTVAQGCGIAIDRTEENAAGLLQTEQVMNRMAEHVIALRGLAQTLQRPMLIERVERLMIEVGFELARFLPEPEDESRH